MTEHERVVDDEIMRPRVICGNGPPSPDSHICLLSPAIIHSPPATDRPAALRLRYALGRSGPAFRANEGRWILISRST